MRRAALDRQLEEADVHRRHAEEQRGTELLEESLGLGVLEPLREPHPAPAREPRAHSVSEAVHVEERQDGEIAVLGRDAPGLDEGARVGREVAVGEYRPLGPARGARRVDDRRRAGIPGNPARAGRRGINPPGSLAREHAHVPGRGSRRNEPGELPRRHDRHRLRVADDVGQLAVLVEGVDRNEDHTELEAGQEQVEELQPVGELDGEPVPGAEPPGREDVRHSARAGLDLAEGQDLDGIAGRAELESGLGRSAHEGRVEDVEKRAAAHSPRVTRLC